MTARVLVTGAQGFVGPYVISCLRSNLQDIVIVPTSRLGGWDPALGDVKALDVNNETAVWEQIESVRPTHVLHLAGWAAVTAAGVNPYATWYTHLFGTLNIAQAILAKAPNCTLLHVSTGQVYGASALSTPQLTEETLLTPTNTYTASKASADLALGALAREGLRCVRLRPFNHTGPHQTEEFVIPSFAFQIARIKLGVQKPLLKVGNLDVARDFLDVRDVAAAYMLALRQADSLPNGCVLNVASGKAYTIREVLMHLIEYSGVKIEIESEQSRVRLGEIDRFVGDWSRAKNLLGWSPRYSLSETLKSVFDWAMETTRAEYPSRL